MADDVQSVKLYLDDLTVGQRFTSLSHGMELDEILEFARRYDPQFFHLDKELASDSLFEGMAASGRQFPYAPGKTMSWSTRTLNLYPGRISSVG